eukprot:218842_1
MARTKQTARKHTGGKNPPRTNQLTRMNARRSVLGKRDASHLDTTEESPDVEILSPQNKKRKLNDSNNHNSELDATTANAKQQLLTLLNDIQQPIEVSCGGRATDIPSIPLLHVKDIGLVPLPLSDIQCEVLIKQMEKSSFGKHLATEQDESIRKSYELTTDKFEFKNDMFNQSVQDLTRSVSSSLGIDYKHVRAVPYKLILYETDSHFVEHRDTEKLENMFGTLIIQLPSIYTVCDDKPVLEVKHLQKEYEYHFGADQKENGCATDVYYVANYCDLRHKVNKIQSGYRLIVTYNLIWSAKDNQNKPQIKAFDHLQQKMNAIYNTWNDPERKPLYIELEHLYTKRELDRNGIEALKGNDYSRMNSLTESDVDHKIRFCIADIVKETDSYDVSGGHYNNYRRNRYGWGREDSDSDDKYAYCEWELNGSSTKIQNLWFLNKQNENQSQNDEKMRELSHLIKDNMLKAIEELDDLDDEDWVETDNVYEGYLGNAGATKNTTYQTCFVLAWKQDSEFDMFIHLGGIGAAIKYLQVFDVPPNQSNIEMKDTDTTATSNTNNKQSNTPLQTVMELFNHTTDCKYIKEIIRIASKAGDIQSIAQFMHQELASNNISINGKSPNSNANQSNYGMRRYRRQNADNDSNATQLMDIWIDLIKEYGWKAPLKQSVLKVLSVIKEEDIKLHLKFIKKLKEFNVEIFKEVTCLIWENMAQKLHLNRDINPNAATKALSKQNTILLFEYLAFCDFDETIQKRMFSTFSMYFLKLSNVEQEQIIYDETMTSLIVNLWNADVCAFLMQVFSNCSAEINSTKNYLLFPKLMKAKQIDANSIQMIYNQIWNNIAIKLDLFEASLPFKRLSSDDIMHLYDYILWNKEQQKEAEEKFTMFYNAYRTHVEPRKQKEICEKINDKRSSFAKQLILLRCEFLALQVQDGEPTVRYRFPNLTNEPSELQFQLFLNSDKVSWKKMGWNSVITARKWARKYQGYSFSAEANGRGRDAYVLVTKNRTILSKQYYQDKRKYEENINELQSLKCHISSL